MGHPLTCLPLMEKMGVGWYRPGRFLTVESGNPVPELWLPGGTILPGGTL